MGTARLQSTPAERVEDFEAAVGTPFTIRLDDGAAVELTLAGVERLSAPAGWEHFAVLFEGPAPALAQRTYPVEHATMGSFPLFLGPYAADAAGVRYEAVFNRQTSG